MSAFWLFPWYETCERFSVCNTSQFCWSWVTNDKIWILTKYLAVCTYVWRAVFDKLRAESSILSRIKRAQAVWPWSRRNLSVNVTHIRSKPRFSFLITIYSLQWQFWEVGGSSCNGATFFTGQNIQLSHPLSPVHQGKIKGYTVTNFQNNFEKPKDILITGDSKILVQFRLKLPNHFSKTIIKCVSLRIARMRMAATWKHQADFIQIISLFYGKIARNWLWFVLHLRNSIDFLLLTFWEYSVYMKKQFISSLAHFHPKT